VRLCKEDGLGEVTYENFWIKSLSNRGTVVMWNLNIIALT